MEQCVILNGDYSFLSIVNWKKALCLWYKGKTEVLKFSEKVVRNGEGREVIKIPLVMRLLKVIRLIYRNKVPFSKKNVMIRDGNRCCYCGSTFQLTIDHVIPISRGGFSNFENCVCACLKCNNKKKNLTPNEAKMWLKKRPYAPTISEFIKIKLTQYKLDEIFLDLFQFNDQGVK